MSSSSRESSPSPSIELPSELARLSACIDDRPEAFGHGDKDMEVAALQAAKYVFDLALKTEAQSRSHISELLLSLSSSFAPQTRSQAASRKENKRGSSPDVILPKIPILDDTPILELCTQAMEEEQLWAQLELRAARVCEVLEYALETTGEGVDENGNERELQISQRRMEGAGDGDVDMEDLEGLESDEDEDFEEDSEDEEDEDEDDDDEEEEGGDEEDGEEAEDLGEHMAELRDPSDEDNSDSDLDKPSVLPGGQRPSRWRAKAKGHPELDDGFFDLAAFNAETEEAESKTVSKGRLAEDEDSDEDMDEEMDYFALVDEGADGELDGTQEILYKDFFEPPARVSSKSKKSRSSTQIAEVSKTSSGKVRFHEEVRVKNIRAKGKNLPTSSMFALDEDEDDEDDEDYDEEMAEGDGLESYGDSFEDTGEVSGSSEDLEALDEDEGPQPHETIERLKDDLFADDDEELDQELSTHQKRMAALQEEIVTLETENVAQKHWTLMGEATSRSRPQNALLEEDLEFERVMKSVPVITEDVVQGLEERIKARILEGRFDDVIRKRPLDDKPFLPSRLFELQDTKSKQSLAQIYEDEYTATQTGGGVGEDRDGKLRKEHQEIEKLWENICTKLDALCNAHFTPKAPKATISTISDVAATSLESALPTTKSTSTMIAPEEVFAPTSSDLRARSELTPVQKRALRNKEKKVRKKAQDTLERSVDKFARAKGIGGVKKQKEAALKTVVKNGKGITVIGKKSKDIIANGRKGKL